MVFRKHHPHTSGHQGTRADQTAVGARCFIMPCLCLFRKDERCGDRGSRRGSFPQALHLIHHGREINTVALLPVYPILSTTNISGATPTPT